MSILRRIKRFILGSMPSSGGADHACVEIRTWYSDLGKRQGASPLPILCVGHLAGLGEEISRWSTLSAFGLDDPAGIEHVCTCPAFEAVGLEFVGVLAQSRVGHPGEAGEAIRRFRASNRRRAAAFYGAWDYNVPRAAGHALSCSADGILMPGIDSNEMFAYLFGVMRRVDEGAEAPGSVEEHVALLRDFTTDESPFWRSQELVVSPYF